ncbi:MAG: hypothetical protein HUK12_03120 [Muribaculaceae bacterium]|nr:hypothetical protein [Muribaculaceae bacterium]
MSNLKEIHVTDTNLRLDNNLIKGGILPNKISELTRTVTVAGETIVEGPVYANKLTIEAAPLEVKGAVFTQRELYINSDVAGDVTFKKAVGSASSVTSRAMKCNTTFCSDVNAKNITLCNAYVSGSLYGDEIVIENCVIIGGVFATQSLTIKDCVVGTFISPYVEMDGNINLLLPSVFSVERVNFTKTSHLYSLALADLGSLFRHQTETQESGKIEINLGTDDLRTTLTDGEHQRSLHSYSVVGKVLAADLIDTDKFQNHFLLTAAALGPQLLKTYDLGTDANGAPAVLTTEKIRAFFFDILHGRIQIKDLDGSFNIEQFARTM